MQNKIMKFDPATRQSNPYPSHAAQWRDYHGQMTAWLFNPWTGELRNPEMVGSDTFGLLITESEQLTSDNCAGISSHADIIIPPLGEYWHGQGGIYAARMRGNAGQPDRHLIVPITSDALNFKSEWGCNGKEITGADNNLYGMPNTAAMAEAGSELAKKILGLEVEGHNDFYLGARHEYRACYLNVPELFNKEWYWTSTQGDVHDAVVQHFCGGNQSYGSKNRSYGVRPIRSFVI